MHQEIIQIILGMKVGSLRQQRAISLRELAQKTNMSVSYLNEIEKGKKFPKVEKMLSLARALEIDYQDLISPKLDGSLGPLATVLQSPIIQKFPFHIFGTSARELLQLMVGHPKEMGILARMLSELGRNYDMRMEQFFQTALRCYQLIHNNYMEEMEEAAAEFRARCGLGPDDLIVHEKLRQVLAAETRFKVLDKPPESLPENLRDLRYLFLPEKRELWLNTRLNAAQRGFIYGRELAYHILGIEDRPTSSPALEAESFEHLFDNWRASYFAGALLLPKGRMQKELDRIFGKTHWHEAAEALLNLTATYGVTPETLFYRLSELVPLFFDTRRVHFLKLSREVGKTNITMDKQLNMSRVHIPNGIGLNEHFCGRWLSVSLLDEMEQKKSEAPIIDAQRSKFLIYGTEFFCMTVAYRGTLRPNLLSTATLGFPVNDALKETIKYWSDDQIEYRELGQTCERCPLQPGHCNERKVEASIYVAEQEAKARQEALAALQ